MNKLFMWFSVIIGLLYIPYTACMTCIICSCGQDMQKNIFTIRRHIMRIHMPQYMREIRVQKELDHCIAHCYFPTCNTQVVADNHSGVITRMLSHLVVHYKAELDAMISILFKNQLPLPESLNNDPIPIVLRRINDKNEKFLPQHKIIEEQKPQEINGIISDKGNAALDTWIESILNIGTS